MQVLQLAASAGDLAVVVEKFVAPSAIVHIPSGAVGHGQQVSGGFLTEAYEAFPDLTLSLQEVMVERLIGLRCSTSWRALTPVRSADSLPRVNP